MRISQWRTKVALVVSVFIAGCATPAVVAPKPDVRPVVDSNKKIKTKSIEIKASTGEATKVNQSLQGDIDSAIHSLDSVLNQ